MAETKNEQQTHSFKRSWGTQLTTSKYISVKILIKHLRTECKS